jgi:hypothetical protein
MLNSKKYDKDTIVSFKIVNGDELIAKIIEETDTGYVIDRPCTVVPSQQGIGLMQSLFTGDLENSSVTLSKAHVMLSVKTINDMEKHYIKTTTGIETPEGSGISIVK